MPLPELISVEEVQSRLSIIFPDGVANRTYLVRLIAARVVFTMLYVGAIEDENVWLGPKHVYCMSDAQATRTSDAERRTYAGQAWKPNYPSIGERWYADTTRESIRDETLREGLVNVGAAIQRTDLPTTSSHPRYALRHDFADLFDPALQGEDFARAAAQWAGSHLSAMALARMALLRHHATAASDKIAVTLPNQTVRQLSQGPSSIITKAVVEEFAPRFLYQPAVILISESGEKIVVQDAALANAIGFKIQPDRVLPDVVLFDLKVGKELLVFVEVVASDGPISESRKLALTKMASAAKIPLGQVAFVTAYQDRGRAAFRKTFGSLAWNTLIWFVSEPDHIVVMRDKPSLQTGRIFDLFE